MRWNRSTRDGWQGSARRVAIHVAVVGIHLGAWLLFFGDIVLPWSLPHTKADLRLDSLSVRLIPTRLQPLARMPPPAEPTPPARPQSPTPAAARRTQERRSAAATAPGLVATTPVAVLPGYIAGGNLLHGNGRDFAPAAHLPGSGIPVVRGLHMTDPRMQGAAGVARALQALFGVADRHCADVEAWRGMTEQERLERHVSVAQVERTAAEYHCGSG